MRSGLRWSLICSLVMVSAGLAQQVQADPIVVTDGEVTLCASPRNCIIGSVSLFGDGLSFGGSTFLGFPLQFVNAGDLIDLSQTAFPATLQGRGPFQQVVNGITYRDVFVGGHLDFSAIPFIAPAPPPGTGFFTPFTMHGQISGFADVQHTIPLFSAAVVGSGTAAMGFSRVPISIDGIARTRASFAGLARYGDCRFDRTPLLQTVSLPDGPKGGLAASAHRGNVAGKAAASPCMRHRDVAVDDR
jgi:hypothetical protein